MVRPSMAPHVLATLRPSTTVQPQDDRRKSGLVGAHPASAADKRTARSERWKQKKIQEQRGVETSDGRTLEESIGGIRSRRTRPRRRSNEEHEDKEDQRQELTRNSDTPTPSSKSLQKLRELVVAAKQAEPAEFQVPMKFGNVVRAIRKNSGMSQTALCRFLVHGFHVESPADALRFHCADLVTLKGSNNASPLVQHEERKNKRSSGQLSDPKPELGYVEILRDNNTFKTGNVFKVVGESNSGSSWKVAALNQMGEAKIKDLQKRSQGDLWQWKKTSEDGLADAMARDALHDKEEHRSHRREQREQRKRQRMNVESDGENDISEADPVEFDESDLPYPWFEFESAEGVYYFNEETGESQWEHPLNHEVSDLEDE